MADSLGATVTVPLAPGLLAVTVPPELVWRNRKTWLRESCGGARVQTTDGQVFHLARRHLPAVVRALAKLNTPVAVTVTFRHRLGSDVLKALALPGDRAEHVEQRLDDWPDGVQKRRWTLSPRAVSR